MKAHFDFGAHVNKHNCRILDEENLRAIFENPLQLKKLIVQCGFSTGGVIGPFQNNDIDR